MPMASGGSSKIVFPVRSNAKSLVTGASLNTVRERIKVASVLYDTVLLEGGVLSMQAGPGGGATWWRPVQPSEVVRWQTPRERGLDQKDSFSLRFGAEATPGVPADRMVSLVESETSISWEATLEPFKREIPAGCAWFDWVESNDPSGELLRSWIRHDQENAALCRAIPERFVRAQVVKHANRDLVLAMGTSCAVSQDNLHARVVRNRFEADQESWRLTGYALPIVIPDVTELSWEGLSAVRKEKGLQQLRGVLEEVELETSEVALRGGDLEAAVHHAVEKRLAKVAGQVDTIPGTLKRTAVGFVVGVATGVATMGITGPLGLLAETVLGSATGGVLDGLALVRDRRAKQWVGVLNRVRDSV